MKIMRVLFSCTGVGILNRGIESFFRESFDGLKDVMPDIEVRLLKGAEGEEGKAEIREQVVWCLPRTGTLAHWSGQLICRNAYVVEQLSSFPFVAREIRRWRPDVIFYSDGNLGFQLYRWRRQIGVPYRLLFSNGGPINGPFARTDFVHQVTPFHHEQALTTGEPPEKHFMVPYGINAGAAPVFDPVVRRQLRAKLNLPVDRAIILSVGWISREHKRMDYMIEEMARLPHPRPFLQLLGAIDKKSAKIIELGNRLLGPENFSAKSLPYNEVGNFYRAVDYFALASVKEGFGRVYLEALMHGLPVIAHRYPVMEYVLGDEGFFGDLNEPGALADLIKKQLRVPNSEQAMRQRWQSVRDRFSWSVLAPQYYQMFKDTADRKCNFL
jgi:1,2-diacylglycerol 3-alpha-glucosyltransferase